MTWIVAANTNKCCIYHFDKNPKTVSLLKEINHSENRLKKSDYLTSDKPGRYQTDGSAGGTYSPHTDPKAAEVDSFAREIAHELNHGRNVQAYKNLIIITPSHMNGLLHQHLDKHVNELIISEIQKDVMTLSHHELLAFLEEHIPKNSIAD